MLSSSTAPHTPRRRHLRLWLAASLGITGTVLVAGIASAALPGASTQLTRAPYLSDLTTSSVQVSWATSTQSRGVVRYGPLGNCAKGSVTSATLGFPMTVQTTREFRNSVTLTGLTAATPYCYRVYTGGISAVDLLGTNPTPQFKTLQPAAGAAPFSFVVLGDWGDTTNNGVNTGTINVNQANLDAQIAASGAQFAISAGDTGYPNGTQTNYGDLNQTGLNVSGVFGPSYWAVPGQRLPYFAASGNHGRNSTYLTVWPETAVTAASAGKYAMVSYPAIDGSVAGSYPTSYYAFSTGGVRFYLLDASWSDANVGTATGGSCGLPCVEYQVDHDAHWTLASAQYQWLLRDLAAHPGGLKMAAFHFPIRSDDSNAPGDPYLMNSPGSTNSLEQLLHNNGVGLVFNGHAHIYQRNVAPPGGVVSYVSGGGGGRLTTIGGKGCSSTDAYGISWSYAANQGRACGGAPVPTTQDQVHHFLKVSVNGTSVTVAPTDSHGRTFDVQTYNFAADAVAPSAPPALVATRPVVTSVALSWASSLDNIGVSAYDIYRGTTYLATTPANLTRFTDYAVAAGTAYTYRVVARDLAGNTRASTINVGAAVAAPRSVVRGGGTGVGAAKVLVIRRVGGLPPRGRPLPRHWR